MLEIARPETKVAARSQSQPVPWGIVDVILAIVMLPFGIWMWLIERMVLAIAKLQPS